MKRKDHDKQIFKKVLAIEGSYKFKIMNKLSPQEEKIMEAFDKEFSNKGHGAFINKEYIKVEKDNIKAWILIKLREERKRVIEDNLNGLQQIMGALSRIGKKQEKDEIDPLMNTKFLLSEQIRIMQIDLDQLKSK